MAVATQPRKTKDIEVLSEIPINVYGLTLVKIRQRDGVERTYKVLHDIWYHVDTPDSLIMILDGLYRSDVRCRFYMGDPATGVDWAEENLTMGTVGRSCGDVKVPLLIPSSRSHGGSGLLTQCILKVTASKGGALIWQSPNYQTPEFTIAKTGEPRFAGTPELTTTVLRVQEGMYEVVANFPSATGAEGYVAFMKGETNSKAYRMRAVG